MDARHAVLYPYDTWRNRGILSWGGDLPDHCDGQTMRGEVSVPPTAYQLVYDVLMKWDEET
jgi:hypothetical protein